MDELERRKNGKLYNPIKTGDENWLKAQILCQKLNSNIALENEKKRKLLEELLGAYSKGCQIILPFRCDLGKNIFLDENVFINMDFLALDEGEIHIGKNTRLGPRVSIYTAIHPLDVFVRNQALETCKAVIIEENVWIGGSVIINGGVTIGKGSVIGSGSVVTRSIPEGVFAAGNPCKVIRLLTDNDFEYWKEQYKEYLKDPDIK